MKTKLYDICLIIRLPCEKKKDTKKFLSLIKNFIGRYLPVWYAIGTPYMSTYKKGEFKKL